MKRIMSILLTIILMLSLYAPAYASSDDALTAANTLYTFGLFYGTGVDVNGNPIYELERVPTRHEAITMLVRLLGKADEAKSGTWDIPFTDVADWAKPYVGYAYTNKLTSGISDSEFGGNNPVTATQYITFVLRALGYSSATDFKWDAAWELSDEIGLTAGTYSPDNNDDFTRGDAALISYAALDTNLKSSELTLLEELIYNRDLKTGGFSTTNCAVDNSATAPMKLTSYFPRDGAQSYYPNFGYATISFSQYIDTQRYPIAYLYNLTDGTMAKLNTVRGYTEFQCLLVLFDQPLAFNTDYLILIPQNSIYGENGTVYNEPIAFKFSTATNAVHVALRNYADYIEKTAVLSDENGRFYTSQLLIGSSTNLAFTDVAPGTYTLYIEGETIGKITVRELGLTHYTF